MILKTRNLERRVQTATCVMLLSVSLAQADRSSSRSLFRAKSDAPAFCLNCCSSSWVTILGRSSKGIRGGLKKPMLPNVRVKLGPRSPCGRARVDFSNQVTFSRMPTALCGSAHRLVVRLTLGFLHHPQQTPVGDFFAPAEPQDHQPRQGGGNGTHRQVGHVDARRQVQLAKGVSEELR